MIGLKRIVASDLQKNMITYAYVQGHQNQNMHWNMQQTATTKIPPALDGATSWFAYDKAIDEWCDVTELQD